LDLTKEATVIGCDGVNVTVELKPHSLAQTRSSDPWIKLKKRELEYEEEEVEPVNPLQVHLLADLINVKVLN
jgi:hypothetical protein